MGLKRVGFWKMPGYDPSVTAMMAAAIFGLLLPSKSEPPPNVRDWVDPTWRAKSPAEYDAVVAYLKREHRPTPYFGWHTCLLCGSQAGTKDISDGEYLWPEGFLHYIEEHHVVPPREFIDHCLGWVGLDSRIGMV